MEGGDRLAQGRQRLVIEVGDGKSLIAAVYMDTGTDNDVVERGIELISANWLSFDKIGARLALRAGELPRA
jgi:hypothetical protein